MAESHEVLESEWAAAMRAHDFARAWAINEADLARRIPKGSPKHEGPRHLQHIWRGEPLAGVRVLVRCYHGLGDTLQFIRFAAPLRRLAREVIVWAQPELLPMIEGVEGVDRALPLHDGVSDVDYDVDIEIMELPFALKATRRMIERMSYLRAEPPLWRFHRDPADCEIHIGLVWRAGDWDRRRSVPLHLFAPLAQTGVRLHLLQPVTVADGLVPFTASDLACAEIPAVAAAISQLDLILTVDTMMAHLAGALGLPVWTLLCEDCDWRWGEGATTPWYPTMRLFRQIRAGDWTNVISEVLEALRMNVRERTQERLRRKEVFATKELTS
jgi:hypothetical protein